jgi:hypothetical protein
LTGPGEQEATVSPASNRSLNKSKQARDFVYRVILGKQMNDSFRSILEHGVHAPAMLAIFHRNSTHLFSQIAVHPSYGNIGNLIFWDQS